MFIVFLLVLNIYQFLDIVDKTAVFVARNGVQFEERIRENEKHNAKFSFLNPNDPYHAYYQYKIAETKEGKAPKKIEAKEIIQEVKDVVPPPRAPPKEPPTFEFMTDMPAISAQDLDILKLTAQFVARNGRQFMTALSQREQRNYQFDFLRPNHSLFNYFTKLVEQYTKVLIPPKNLNEKLRHNVDNKYQILDRVMQRVEYAAYQEEERKKAEEKEDQERIAYASIDWHDFVIVETVEFTEADETIDLPPPMSIMELENMTLAQKKMASVNLVESQPDEKVGEIDMEMDDDVDMEEDEEEGENEDQDQEITPVVVEIKPPDTSAPMKIVKDYTPKAYALKSAVDRPTVICPRCKQVIPVDEMDDHVRIELLDPKWREQKLAAELKKKESNLLQEGTDVAKNLKAFSGYRSDIFGTEETEIGRKIGEEEEKKKRIEKEKVVWDGHTASINMATQRAAAGVSIDEQIAAIHRSKGLTSDSDSKIGPKIPQVQDQRYQHPHQQGIQHTPPQQPPVYPGYPTHSAQGVPGIPPGPPPAPYPGYVPSSAPFAHQLPGYISPLTTQGTTSQQYSQDRQPIPQQIHRSNPSSGMSASSSAPAPPLPPTPLAMGQSPPAPPAPPTPPLPPIPPSKTGRTIEDEVELSLMIKRQKMDPSVGGGLVSAEEWIELHQGPINLQVQCPTIPDKPEWKCQGQTIILDNLPLTTFVSTVKDRIAARLNFPAGRQKLTIGGVVMKNQLSLAHYNTEDGDIIGLSIKDRGKK
jgi:splicing factor 3A subunit 1